MSSGVTVARGVLLALVLLVGLAVVTIGASPYTSKSHCCCCSLHTRRPSLKINLSPLPVFLQGCQRRQRRLADLRIRLRVQPSCSYLRVATPRRPSLHEELDEERPIHNSSGMERDIGPDWQKRSISPDTQMNVLGATGGLRESAARDLMAENQEHDRTTPGHPGNIDHFGSFGSRSSVPSREASRNVGGQHTIQHWQYGMPTYDACSPDWNYSDYADSMMPMLADKYERTPPTQPAMGCNDQYPQASYCPSEPWNVSVLSNSRTYSHHRRNAVPTISIDSPNGESGVTGPRAAGGCTSYCNAAATTSTLSTYCLSEHEAQVEGWSGSYLSPETYNQASSSRRSSMSSIASAPSRLAVVSSDHTATPTEYCGWRSPSTSPK